MPRPRLLVASALVLLAAAPALALRVGGGRNPATDCFATFDVPGSLEDTAITCTDCDPSCDRDGVATPNGSCTFAPSLCLNQSDVLCQPAALIDVRVRPLGTVPVPALDDDACGARGASVVRVRGRKPGKGRLRVRATAAGARDRNALRFVCKPRPPGERCPATEAREACTQHDPLRRPFFGDLHVHTTQSFDAHAFDVDTTPAQAYAFAKGAPVSLPPLDAFGQPTRIVQIDRPLDFAAVTDHSEYLAEIEECTVPGSAAYDSATCQMYRGPDVYNAVGQFGIRFVPTAPTRFPDICGADGLGCIPTATAVWQRTLDATEAAYDRSAACTFTSFPAYEWTGSTGVSTLHRNVIFRTERVPLPTTYFEQPTAQGLWTELRSTCLDAPFGCDVLAIPHNSNESNGKMFLVEYPGATTIDEQRVKAAERASMEPLVEIYQHKGDSECMNGLSGIFGAPDELCGFEKEVRTPFVDCGDGTGALGSARQGCFSRRDFVRNALLEGLGEAGRIGVNPFQLGFIGSTDTHNGTPGFVEETTFGGHRGTDDDTPAKQLGRGVLTLGGISFGPGGLAGIWAEENSRPSLFEALRRRETFATSGPRMTVRFFGGWDAWPGVCAASDLAAQGYARGVPMGGELPAPPPGATAPSFVVAAMKDAGTATHPGAPLQRIQIVKGWIENGERHQQVFEVAGDPLNGATVDDATCVPSGPGFDSLCGVWTDPQFDPMQHAFYYARVVENPTCRWHAFLCNSLAPADRPASCTDPTWPRAIQERAWSSPIWYDAQG